MPKTIEPRAFLSEGETAAALGWTVEALRLARRNGSGPPFSTVAANFASGGGRNRVVYLRRVVLAWREAQKTRAEIALVEAARKAAK